MPLGASYKRHDTQHTSVIVAAFRLTAEHSRDRQRCRKVVVVDELTGIPNRLRRGAGGPSRTVLARRTRGRYCACRALRCGLPLAGRLAVLRRGYHYPNDEGEQRAYGEDSLARTTVRLAALVLHEPVHEVASNGERTEDEKGA